MTKRRRRLKVIETENIKEKRARIYYIVITLIHIIYNTCIVYIILSIPIPINKIRM